MIPEQSLFFKNIFLVLGVGLASVLALTEMPPWIALFVLICLVVRFCIEKKWIKPLATPIVVLLGLTLFAVVYIQYRSLFGQLESSILIVGLTALSILNYSQERDRKLVTLLSFILVILKSMFAPEVYWLLLSAVSFILLWISMLSDGFVTNKKMLAQLFIKAVPLTIILFLIFPRIVLYQNQKYQQRFGQTGFSDQLRPGQIAQIVQDDTLAFYAQFDSDLKKQPPLNQDRLYWRGGVLSESQGLVWKTKPSAKLITAETDKNGDTDLKYQMYFEPHLRSYLFTLDLPTKLIFSDKQVQKNSEHTYRIRDWINSQTVARFESKSNGQFESDSKQNGEFSENSVNWEESPQTWQWLTDLRNQKLSPGQKLAALDEFFKKLNLKYSFQPGFYSESAFDDLLFKRKVGFCEHFAAAYATLARELGISARVVVGYQGGSYNPIGQFWRVTQKEAHAWVEVLSDQNWIRVDPTSWIAPLRLQLSSAEYMQLNENQLALSYNEYLKIKNQNFLNDWWFQTTAVIENINYLWSTFVVDFDMNRQLDLISQIFSFSQKSPQVIVAVILTMIVMGFIFWVLGIRPKKNQIFNRPYELIYKDASKLNIPVNPQMTGLEIIQLFKKHFPDFNEVQIQWAYDTEVYLNTNLSKDRFQKIWKAEIKKLTSQPSHPKTY